MSKPSYFVIAAMVASELHQASLVASNVSLIASNARALALRAGRGAAGFRAITEFIDGLAAKTILFSSQISRQAITISRFASEGVRMETALQCFKRAQLLAQDAAFITSTSKHLSRVQVEYEDMMSQFDKQVWQLASQLDDLSRELQTANVLSVMSKVEASQSGREFEVPLTVIADNVQAAAGSIASRVEKSKHLFEHLKRN